MTKQSNRQSGDLTGPITWFAKDLGKLILTGFGRILAIGAGAAVFGGIGGAVTAAVYGGPIVGFAIGGAVLAVVAVFALYLLFAINY